MLYWNNTYTKCWKKEVKIRYSFEHKVVQNFICNSYFKILQLDYFSCWNRIQILFKLVVQFSLRPIVDMTMDFLNTYLQIEVNKPGQGVLVHGLNICQVRYTEEQNGWMDSHRLVPIPCLINHDLSLCGNFLFGCNLLGQGFGRGQDLDGRLIF